MAAVAKAAKDKGNAAFKTGDFATAVGHYSAAIVADRADPTLPLNRAAAYLKLGKNQDAERDCSTVLSLPLGKNNVKALFRRAQARIALEKVAEAESDLREAIRLEPENDAVKAELSKLTSASFTGKTPTKPYRRRVPIAVVDEPPLSRISSSTASTSKATQPLPGPSIMNEVSSRPLKPSGTGTANSTPAAPSTQTPPPRDPWTAREVNGHRVGGGIIRKGAKPIPIPVNGVSKPDVAVKEKAVVEDLKSDEMDSTQTFDVSNRTRPSAIPTLFDFNRALNSASSSEAKWSVIQDIPPSSLPKLFLNSLEPPSLVSILDVFKTVLPNSSAEAKTLVQEYMTSFPKVSRFQFVVMFLSPQEQSLVKNVWTILGEEPGKGLAAGWATL